MFVCFARVPLRNVNEHLMVRYVKVMRILTNKCTIFLKFYSFNFKVSAVIIELVTDQTGALETLSTIYTYETAFSNTQDF